jgi:hypothetical protein
VGVELIDGVTNRLGVVIAVVVAGALAGACDGGSATGGSVSATVDGVSWRSPGQAFIINNHDGTATFDVQAGTLLPSGLIDSSKPQLLIVFPQVPSVGTYNIDGVTVNVDYQTDVNAVYCGSNGSVQITSISTSRARGAFNFEAQAPIINPMTHTLTDGAFDVPVSAH